jgi:hypothetical protein
MKLTRMYIDSKNAMVIDDYDICGTEHVMC